MMKLIAKKPCSFGGERFYIGDEIPAELVKEPKTQEKYGVLAIVEGDAVTPAPTVNATVVSDPVLNISVAVDGEQMDLEPTDDGLQDIFNALISDADNAIAIVNKMNDNDALILLHLSERRTTVKKAAKVRAEKLQESAGEQ
jgi:hypothetical protein